MKTAAALVLVILVSGCHAKVVHRNDYPVTVHDGDKVLAHCQKWDNKKVVVSGCQIEKGATLDQVLTAIAKADLRTCIGSRKGRHKQQDLRSNHENLLRCFTAGNGGDGVGAAGALHDGWVNAHSIESDI